MLVLVYLLATGLPLQFAPELNLGQRHVASEWVLDWYGLQAPDEGIRSGPAVMLGGTLFLNGIQQTGLGGLMGALPAGGGLAVAGPNEVWLFHPGVPDPERTAFGPSIERIGSLDGQIYLDTTQGLLAADGLLMNWNPTRAPTGGIEWASATPLSAFEAAAYRQRFRSRMLTAERWLQDLHSGRFFGTVGVIIVDAASLLMLILAGTGLMLWWRSKRG